MQKVLIVSEYVPYPPHLNGEVSTLYNLINSDYMDEYSVDLLYLENEESKYESIFADKIDSLIRVPAQGREVILSVNGKNIIKPFGIWRIKNSIFKGFDASKYDIIIYGSMLEACLMGKINTDKAFKIIFAADSPVLYYSTKNRGNYGFHKKVYNWIQKKLWIKYEKAISFYTNRIAYVSEKDTNTVSEYLNKVETKTARLGVKTSEQKENHKRKGTLDIGFSGVMTYAPNHKAVEFIIDEIAPLLTKKNIDYRIHIIGKNPDPQWVERFKNSNIIITGFLDNIDGYIAKMDMYISPLFEGSGMKNKILQSLSIGVPIIASQTSVDGIDGMKDGYNYILCDDKPDNWVSEILELYKDYEKRVSFSNNGKKLIEEEYSWNRFAKDLIE